MKARTKLLVIFAALFVFGIYMVIDSGKDSREMANGMMNFNKMKISDFRDGAFVQGEVWLLEDEFAYEEETRSSYGIKVSERVSAHYYVMPLSGSYTEGSDSIQLAAVKIGNTEAAAIADNMVQESYDYYYYGTEPEQWTSFDMTGKIAPMDDEIMGYFKEWVDYNYPDGGITYDCICPYVIEWRVPEAASNLMTAGAVMLAVGAAGAAVIIMLILREKNASAQVPDAGYSPAPADTSPEVTSTSTSAERTYNFTAEPGSMDDIDTSSLGIGIGDEEK